MILEARVVRDGDDLLIPLTEEAVRALELEEGDRVEVTMLRKAEP
jgi:hypothetical protein